MNFFVDVLHNKVIVASFLGWLIAQIIKVIIGFVYEKRLDFTRLIGLGGMPSSHAATVCAGGIVIGLLDGFTSTAFGLCVMFCSVVMTDAAGVRRAAGKQAELLNELADLVIHNKGGTGKKLKELLGHTPLEVTAGGLLGIAVGILWYLV